MECDVAVLGGGPGGYTAAIRAAQLGAKTVCIEQEPELGGTCLRIGCIPTKAWVQTAFAIKEAEHTFAKLGVQVGAPSLDFATANEWKSQVVHQMTQGVASLFKANGVEWVKGTGRFTDAHTIAVEGAEAVSFKSAIVATGSFPLWPPIDGLDSQRCVDSELACTVELILTGRRGDHVGAERLRDCQAGGRDAAADSPHEQPFALAQVCLRGEHPVRRFEDQRECRGGLEVETLR